MNVKTVASDFAFVWNCLFFIFCNCKSPS